MVKRSEFYHLINPTAPINHVLRARADVWGTVATLSLTLGMMSLMRMLLAWVQ
jgi:hypothetical protein